MRSKKKWLYVCRSGDLREGEHITLDIVYNGELHSSIIFRFNKKTYAYINRCVHMPRKLNCELDDIFDDSGKYLRCSMHGIVYDPETGISQSSMCQGEKLKPLKVVEENGYIYFNDKRVLDSI